ncbi:hypothetical protein BX616_006713 [Lobosporangium transversale]|uniref:Uncharacterized protein n=1 Tax=Lobosporangium transversale TaxID=64571 RepID=A0A1Y2GK97_9FUNG|nr:hypothetical protein BCR41DRAFT_93207 [Lobosporangium transversale]KAF9896811.1 hypothetical protein BX616_006713 [Lobosporangium transversale]ORZ13345.1 hypothetical protein BCR41DRAFT_93207 [Lobosporangium transversale]|eukprot:XP_021880426.1 hypothetical protein BCR41DRAFT_93207 [Lobosporangium transversale]
MFTVCCQGKSDAYIAALCRGQSRVNRGLNVLERFAVSSDSDFLIYPSISYVVRRLTGQEGFVLLRKIDVMQALRLPSPDHLEDFGVVSKNDYTNNIPQYGLSRNLNIIRKLPQAQSARALLASYITTMNQRPITAIASEYFALAGNVFLDITPHLCRSQHISAKDQAPISSGHTSRVKKQSCIPKQ